MDRIIFSDFTVFLAIVNLCTSVDTLWKEMLLVCTVCTLYTETPVKSVSHLPDPDDSVGDEDKKNNDRLNKGGGCLLSLLKQSQHLDEHNNISRHILL